MFEAIYTKSAAAPSGSYSQAITWSGLVQTAGQVGKDPVTGARPEALRDEIALAFKNLEAVLEAAGADLGSVVKTTCFLTDVDDFELFDAVYRERFSEPFPARSTVAVRLAGGWRFEIEALAMRRRED